MLPPFAAIRAFEAVGRLGGIRKAADHLAVHQAVVSRHIRTLEAATGVRLIERNHNGIALTPKGKRYLERIGVAFSEIVAATDELVDFDDHTLKIWCTPGLAVQWLLPVLDQFEDTHAGLTLEVRPTDRMPDFRRSEADLNICYLTEPPQFDRKLVRSFEVAVAPTFPVAIPELAARHRDLLEPGGLARARLIHNGDHTEWQAWLHGRGIENTDVENGPIFGHPLIAIDAVKRGDGILLSNTLLIGEALANGELVRVLPADTTPDPVLGAYYCVGGIRRWNSKPGIEFRRWLIKSVAIALDAAAPRVAEVHRAHD